jgi:hypothetical protein
MLHDDDPPGRRVQVLHKTTEAMNRLLIKTALWILDQVDTEAIEHKATWTHIKGQLQYEINKLKI